MIALSSQYRVLASPRRRRNVVKPGAQADGMSVRYENSWDIRMLAGLGYEF